MITKHTQLLNYLIDRYGLKNYLEIGINRPENNFDKINAERRIGVDPCLKNEGIYEEMETSDIFREFKAVACLIGLSSDEYFSKKPDSVKFDLIFIDGLHHADQVKKDFENSLRCLNDGGFIVIHDTLPDEEIATCVPRGEQKKWFGDVYKWAMELHKYAGIDFITLNADCGCTIVWKDKSIISGGVFDKRLNAKLQAATPDQSAAHYSMDINWQSYSMFGDGLLNIIEPAQLMERLPVRVKEPVA